jgi:hypothetical protein
VESAKSGNDRQGIAPASGSEPYLLIVQLHREVIVFSDPVVGGKETHRAADSSFRSACLTYDPKLLTW